MSQVWKAIVLIALVGWCAEACGQGLLPNGMQQFVDANGAPLAGGKVYLYVPGTTTPKTTWMDQAESTANANPVVLDAAGRAIIWGNGTYRQLVQDVLGNVIWDQLTSSLLGQSSGSFANGDGICWNNGLVDCGGVPVLAPGSLATIGNVAVFGTINGKQSLNDSGFGFPINLFTSSQVDGKTGGPTGEANPWKYLGYNNVTSVIKIGCGGYLLQANLSLDGSFTSSIQNDYACQTWDSTTTHGQNFYNPNNAPLVDDNDRTIRAQNFAVVSNNQLVLNTKANNFTASIVGGALTGFTISPTISGYTPSQQIHLAVNDGSNTAVFLLCTMDGSGNFTSDSQCAGLPTANFGLPGNTLLIPELPPVINSLAVLDVGPQLKLSRQTTTIIPNAGSLIGEIFWEATCTSGGVCGYAQQYAKVVNGTAGANTGAMQLDLWNAGSPGISYSFRHSGLSYSGAPAFIDSGCGTGAALAGGSTSMAGTITFGTGSPAACAIKWAIGSGYSNQPSSCVVSESVPDTNFQYTFTTGQLSLAATAFTNGRFVNWICIGRDL